MKFVLMDVDYMLNRVGEPIVRLYGKEYSSENRIIIHVTGFEPYFYVERLDLDDGADLIEEIKKIDGVKKIEVVKMYKPVGYQVEKIEMVKVYVWQPKMVPEVRERVEAIGVSGRSVYEADVLFKDRFMIDKGFNGMDVLTFTMGNMVKNYGMDTDNLWIMKVSDIHKTNAIVNFEY